MTNYSRWMAQIADDVNMSSLALPGTHNSGAFFKLAAPSVRCQGSDISTQLHNGVRFLHFNLSKNYMSRGENINDLLVVNGKFPVKLSGTYKFKHVLKDVYNFLDENPTETVLVSITIKLQNFMLNWDKNSDEVPRVLFEKYIGHNRNKWYLSDKIPDLNVARGKAVLLRGFPVLPDGIYKRFGLDSTGQLNNTVCVQNFDNIKNPEDINKKASYIVDMMDTAKTYNNSRKNSNSSNDSSVAEQSDFSDHETSPSTSSSSSMNSIDQTTNPKNPKLFINFCNGANLLNANFWPSNVDKKLRKHNFHQHYDKNCGIIVLDFADRDDWNLVHKLIDVNFIS